MILLCDRLKTIDHRPDPRGIFTPENLPGVKIQLPSAERYCQHRISADVPLAIAKDVVERSFDDYLVLLDQLHANCQLGTLQDVMNSAFNQGDHGLLLLNLCRHASWFGQFRLCANAVAELLDRLREGLDGVSRILELSAQQLDRVGGCRGFDRVEHLLGFRGARRRDRGAQEQDREQPVLPLP